MGAFEIGAHAVPVQHEVLRPEGGPLATLVKAPEHRGQKHLHGRDVEPFEGDAIGVRVVGGEGEAGGILGERMIIEDGRGLDADAVDTGDDLASSNGTKAKSDSDVF